ncbi:MAG: glycerol-3-phosphate 1-O-acyltransferase PlsY [Candidatus Hydrogenedentota bacterium]
MTSIYTLLALFLFSYLVGSIPAGYIYGRLMGIDIKKEGSGNVGATNVMRVLGRKAGIAVLFFDILKGFIPVELGSLYFRNEGIIIICGILSIIGHMYPVWLGFRGGKGVATSCGVFIALVPGVVLMGFIVFVITVIFTRFVSVGSIIISIFVPVCIFLEGKIILGIFSVIVGAIIIYRHKENIKRILEGRENKIF